MSHFTLLVALPSDTDPAQLQEELDKRLAPFDENVSVAPRRSYEDGSPEEYWWVGAVRRDAAARDADEPIKLGSPTPGRGYWSHTAGDYLTYSEAMAEARESRERHAAAADRLPVPLTWEAVVREYNLFYGHGEAAVVPLGEVEQADDRERLHYEPETGRAYTITTYNPDSKWDWWTIGGRWTGYFPVKGQAPDLITGDDSIGRSVFNRDLVNERAGKVDGGRKKDLDLDALRDEREADTRAEYERWVYVTSEHPEPKPWEHFIGLAQAGEITIDEAREQYRSQPAIEAAKQDGRERREQTGRDQWGWEWDVPVEKFQFGLDPAVEKARLGAIPGYALLTLEGEWVAPGEMGWFGMSTDGPGEKEGYQHAVNTYINDKVKDDDFLVLLDLHI